MDLTRLKTNFILIQDSPWPCTWLLHLQYTYILFFMGQDGMCVDVLVNKKGEDEEGNSLSFRPLRKTRDCSALFVKLILNLSHDNLASNTVVRAYLKDLRLLIAKGVVEIDDLWI